LAEQGGKNSEPKLSKKQGEVPHLIEGGTRGAVGTGTALGVVPALRQYHKKNKASRASLFKGLKNKHKPRKGA